MVRFSLMAITFILASITFSCTAAPGEGAPTGGAENPFSSVDTLRSLADARGILIGAAVVPGYIQSEPLYNAVLKREFNCLVAENCMKFSATEPSQGNFTWTDADYLVNYAAANNMTVRGHALVWHEQSDWVSNLGYQPTLVSNILANHIAQVVGRYAGKVKIWDVVNEAINNNPVNTSIETSLRKSFWWTNLGSTYIETAFRLARAADANAKLFYNEYGCEGFNGWNDKTIATYKLITNLIGRGVPIDGIGFQMHIDEYGYPMSDSFALNLKRFTDLKGGTFQVHITELDVRLTNKNGFSDRYALQAKIYSDIIATCLSNTNVTAILTWGITDKHSWIPNIMPGNGAALPFDSSYNPKPAYTNMIIALRYPYYELSVDSGGLSSGEEWKLQFQKGLNNGLQNGTSYTFTCSLKASSAVSGLIISANSGATGASSAYKLLWSQSIDVGTTWSNYALTIAPSESDSDASVIQFNVGSLPSGTLVDIRKVNVKDGSTELLVNGDFSVQSGWQINIDGATSNIALSGSYH